MILVGFKEQSVVESLTLPYLNGSHSKFFKFIENAKINIVVFTNVYIYIVIFLVKLRHLGQRYDIFRLSFRKVIPI